MLLSLFDFFMWLWSCPPRPAIRWRTDEKQRARYPKQGDQQSHLQMSDGCRAEAEHPDANRSSALLVGHGHLNEGLLKYIECACTAACDDQHGCCDDQVTGQCQPEE